MQRNMVTPQLVLSGLCVALLTACGGGGGNEGIFDKDAPRPGFTGTDNSNVPLKPADGIRNVNPVNKLFSAKDVGQQNGPKVAVVDNNGNGKHDSSDEIKYNQPGIVSQIAAASDIFGFSKIKDEANKLKSPMEQAKTAMEQAADAQALAEAKQKYNDAGMAFYNSGISSYADYPDDAVTILDVNDGIRTVNTFNTIDYPKIPTHFKDAGVMKIDYQRVQDKDGNKNLIPYGGSTGAVFNMVDLFGLDNNSAEIKNGELVIHDKTGYYDSYFRNPSAAGWSYQTFGFYFNNDLEQLRDLLVGFQSIGDPTKSAELPKDGKATYTGVAQAFYNDDQVTMTNRINANFSNRDLTYETTGKALYHTFEKVSGKDSHIVEERPELNLTGHATWEKGISQFEGEIHSGNGLKGKIEGRFYGSQAAEVGGVYGLTGTAGGQVVHYVGGFGARRP